MATHVLFNTQWLGKLLADPMRSVRGVLDDMPYTANLMIAHYHKNIGEHYSSIIQGSLDQECQRVHMPRCFEHFGVSIQFEKPMEVNLYNDKLVIHSGLCELISQVGIVTLKNVYLASAVRSYGHRNRFPHLQFHIDRGANQSERYSMYTRDPFCEEQKFPRTASTLFVPNCVAHLQELKEGTVRRDEGSRVITSTRLFENEDVSEISGKVILEQRWDQPEGVGEIAMIDNATVLHASYYRDALRSGYRIGVRYLGGLAAA